MSYRLKEDASIEIRKKFKNIYFEQVVGLSKIYVSLILNRHRAIPKRIAYCFTKAIDSNAEIEDYFEVE